MKGKGMIQIDEHKRTSLFGPVMGSTERVDRIMGWSGENDTGEKWEKKFPIGLTVMVVANEETPRVYLYWNQHRFQKFIKGTAQGLTHLSTCVYGISIIYSKKDNRTVVKLITRNTKPLLWDSKKIFEPEPSNTDWLCGMVSFAEEGFIFFNGEEARAVAEITAPVAIITKSRVGTVQSDKRSLSDMLNEPRKPMTERTRNWMFSDVLLNEAKNNYRKV